MGLVITSRRDSVTFRTSVSTSGVVGARNQRGMLWFQEDSYSDEDSGTEEVSDAED